MSAVQGRSAELLIVMRGVAAVGSLMLVPGMMKLMFGRPMVRA